MKIRKAIALAFSFIIVASLALAACGRKPAAVQDQNGVPSPSDNPSTNTAPAGGGVVSDEVVLRLYDTSDIPELDPQKASDVTSINAIENLFVQLTNYDLETAEIVPEAATDWTISEDGLTYTFTIRTDIPWVRYNPATGEITQVVDEDGNPRFVTAYDFEYGIRRACDPNLGSYYSSVIAPNILGCNDVLNSEQATEETVAAIGVAALDERTLEVQLVQQVGFFSSMTPMWTLSAVPSWTIQEHGDLWVEADFIVTSGRYSLARWIHGVSREFVRNPLMPEDMRGSGNIDRIVVDVVPDRSDGYTLWLAGRVEQSKIPSDELQNHLKTYPDETYQIADLAVVYFGFAMEKPPFNDPDVRAAFSAAFDRETYIETTRQGQGLPMKHFAPPGIFGAPPIDEIGVGFDVEFAQAKLAEAGYPDCKGFPKFTLYAAAGQEVLKWIEMAQINWSEHLGCDPKLITLEQFTFAELLAATDPGNADRANIWTAAWGPDYADENNWVGDLLWCEVDSDLVRDCSEVDDLIAAAKKETDPTRRVELYAEIEDKFFGEDGIFPIAPIFLRIDFVAVHSWFEFTPALFGGNQYYNYTLDAAARAGKPGN